MDVPGIDDARGGDQAAFSRLAEPFRPELQVHCYRMLGSVEDAEDAVQETYLRAWSRLDTYAGRASFRAWLYGIATHACLDALRRRKARVWPPDLVAPGDPRREPTPPVELPWLQPYPDRLLDAPAPVEDEPEALVTSKETIELAFLAAIQRLPARQRAVLILRDVLEWPARETATSLGMTQTAVNSALQRAHSTLAQHLVVDRNEWSSDSTETEKALLKQLIDAWERSDAAALVALLRSDARLVMPPRLSWFSGRDDVEEFFQGHVFGKMGGQWALLPTAANRQPAFALYCRAPGRHTHDAFGIGALQIVDGAITEIAMFTDPGLFGRFALPAHL
ncbi:sigma-70 family RNA polymerase sigma factor [Pseudofrankia sp. BMG5.37]|uniref:sigma-70 family RNA polymerase sigma factor n=1 Tax=Pseudofrankia sp. BMG5.37 TaxID=3050035 RepID=UPI002895795B|nr:sigma-70 family RNA polymerase sigma factor [Pseudofrankia sp. BMG5.37]MDT3443634.1 sigma-70 family RNA polymerase sigma factor [Pseudofrankia sp. BMG5.37]